MLSSSLMAMQQLRTSALFSSARLMATAASSSSGTSAGSKKSGSSEPSFFYAPPGSSMREPLLISLSDPVYYYDAGKSSLSDALPSVDQKVPAAEPPRPTKLPMVALTGSDKPAAEPAGAKQHPYRMTDDMANQPYTISNRNSMRDPKYVSMGEPLYVMDGKKPKQ